MKITTCLGALAMGLALVSTAAVAQEPNGVHRTHAAPRTDRGPTYYRNAPDAGQEAPLAGAPLSPGGVSTGGSSPYGPGYNPAPNAR